MNPQPHNEHFILIICALVLPPLAVFLVKKYSIWNKEFLVSVLLTMFGHIPGAIFTLYYLICIEFPQSNGEGYNRLDDDESRLPQHRYQEVHQEEQQEQQRQQQGEQKKQQHQSQQQEGIYVGSSSTPQASPEDLPAYEDVVSTTGDSKVDNKIQR